MPTEKYEVRFVWFNKGAAQCDDIVVNANSIDEARSEARNALARKHSISVSFAASISRVTRGAR
jgi:hypothetical protein